MTELLERAFDEASKLPRDRQDAIPRSFSGSCSPNRDWDRAFEDSQDALARLANDALAEDERGETEDLDPSTL